MVLMTRACGGLQVRAVRKAEVQTQRRAEKAARETAQQERELRSYSHLMQARMYRVTLVWCTSVIAHTFAKQTLAWNTRPCHFMPV
jgi:hypothetical protein